MTTAWPARLYSTIALSMRSSQRSGELQLISEIETGARSSASSPPKRIFAHLDRVERVRARDHRAHVRLVRQRLQRVDHVEVARVERRVVGLDDRAARRVELVERLREPHEVLEVGHRRVAPLGALAHERRAVDGREDHVVAADVRAALGVARLQLELARGLGDLLEDELRIELDQVVALDRLTGGAEQLDGLREQELDAELGHDPPPAAVERVDGVLAEDLVPRHCVDEHAAPLTYLAWNKSSNVRRGRRRSTVRRSC